MRSKIFPTISLSLCFWLAMSALDEPASCRRLLSYICRETIMKDIIDITTILASKRCLSLMRQGSHEFYRKWQESSVCKILWLSTGRCVSTIHPIGKILFDEINDSIFQVDIETSLEVNRQREKSHDSAPLFHTVVGYFFDDSCLNFFRVVTILVDAVTQDRVQLEKILSSGPAANSIIRLVNANIGCRVIISFTNNRLGRAECWAVDVVLSVAKFCDN